MSDYLGAAACILAIVFGVWGAVWLWQMKAESDRLRQAQQQPPAERLVLAGQGEETGDQAQAHQVQTELTEDQDQAAWEPVARSGPEPWLIQLARVANVSAYDRRAAEQLEAWAASVARVAVVEFQGQLSPKLGLHPYFQRATAGYEDVPAAWKSLHFLEELCGVLRNNGFADLRSRREGLRLTEAGIDKFQADPGRWYP